jgi:polar amino acid transport system substrate-binding protein
MSLHIRNLNVSVVFVTYIFFCSLWLAGCGGSSTITSHLVAHTAIATTPYELASPGYLTVGTIDDRPPMEFTDATTHQLVGFDIDLINALASRLKLQVKLVPTTMDMLLPALNTKHYDVALADITITGQRKQEASFIPYFSQGQSLLVQSGNPHAIESIADLCGQSVGVQSGSLEQSELQAASAACQRAGEAAINNVVLQDQSAVIQLLATNRVVATYQDSPVTSYYLQQSAGRFALAGVVTNTAIAGIAVRKTDGTLQTAIQNALNQVERNGTYHTLLDKWGLADGAIA